MPQSIAMSTFQVPLRAPLLPLEQEPGLSLYSIKDGSTGSLRAAERVAILVPNSSLVQQARQQLAQSIATVGRSGGLLWPGVRTLRQTADAVLGHAPQPVRPLSSAQKHRVVLEVLERAERAGRLEHFGRIVQRDQLARVLAGSFAALGRQLGAGHLDPQPQVGFAADAGERELSSLYRHYQQTLARDQLLDAEGRLALATRLLREGRLGPLAGVEEVWLSGIRQLSPLEVDFVRALAAAVGKATLLLPALADGDSLVAAGQSVQGEASIAKPSRALKRLKEQLSAVTDASSEAIRDSSGTNQFAKRTADLQRVSDWLFQDPRRAPPIDPDRQPLHDRSYFAKIAAPGSYREMQLVAAEVKRLLLNGTPPEAISITSRNTRLVSTGLRQAFNELGIPLEDATGRTLSDAPIAQCFARIMRLVCDDWPRDELLTLVTSPALSCFDAAQHEAREQLQYDCRRYRFAGPRAAAEWCLRALLLPGGRSAWLGQLKSLASRHVQQRDEPEQPTGSQRRDRLSFAASLALELLAPLVEATEEYQLAATPLEWFDRLRATAALLGYRSAGDAAKAEADQTALEVLERATAEADHLANWQRREASQLDADEWQSLLKVTIAETTLPSASSGEGQIQLLPPETARSLRPDYLFLVGMTEQSFPAAPPAAPIASLGKQEVDHYSEEMLLFYELIHSASRGVVFSYPSLDSAGQPLNPSSYVAEVERLLGPALRKIADSPGLSVASLRLAAVEKLNEGDGHPLARVPPDAGRQVLLSGLRVSLDRSRGDGFGAAEGMLQSEAAQTKLAQSYSSQHLWSPSQLELFATCPFKFFLRQVLGIEETPELALETDHRRRGSLLHDAMLRLHSELKDRGPIAEVLRGLSDEEFQAEFSRAIDAADAAVALPSHERPLAEIETLQADAWGPLYREQLSDYLSSEVAHRGAMQPAHFEVRFGPPREGDPPLELPSRAEPFALSLADEELLLTGQVDRIDVAEIDGRLWFNVIDYKTAKELKPKLADLESGRQLQLYLYTLATEELLRSGGEVAPWRLGYWVIRSGGFISPSAGRGKSRVELQPTETDEQGGVVAAEVWNEYGEAVRQRISQMVYGVRHGEFPMFNTDQNCAGRCEFSTTCRVNQTRSLGKQPPESAGGVEATAGEWEAEA